MLSKIIEERISTIARSIFSHKSNKPYWIKITTQQPSCIYYFGAFDSRAEARKMRHGYIEDLVEEQATNIVVKIERCSPTKLTITDEKLLF